MPEMDQQTIPNKAWSIDDFVGKSPMKMEGVVPYLDFGEKQFKPRLVFPENGSVDLTGNKLYYICFFFMHGYGKRSELLDMVHSFSVYDRAVDITIRDIRRITGAYGDLIEQRHGSGEYEGGYYIGNIAQHRNDPSNLVRNEHLRLNTVTGCLRMPDNQVVLLSPLETEIMYRFIKAGDREVQGSSLNSEVFKKMPSGRDSLTSSLTRIKCKIRPHGMDIVSAQYGTFSYRLQPMQLV